MRTRHPIALALLFLAASTHPSARAQETAPDRLSTLRSQFEELQADLFTAEKTWDARYLEELNKLELKAQDSADLELVLAVRKETKTYRTRPPVASKPSPHEALARLQGIYDTQKARIEAEKFEKFASLLTGYKKQLTDLRIELTKAEDIDGAVVAQAELRRVEKLTPSGSPSLAGSTASGVAGRYVRVSMEGKGKYVMLAEVKVFNGDTNIAAEGTASPSSVHEFGGSADRAIDGNTDGRLYGARSTSHTKKESDPWWEVDLGKDVPISKIVFWSRTDNGLYTRMNGFKVSVLNTRRLTEWEKTIPTAPANDLTFDLESD